jgi:hypothetical protein
MDVVISKSDNKNKKMKAVINGKKTVHFGQAGASDMTQHKDKDRKQRYIDRHKKNENWGASGVDTAGFYSRWLTWNKDTLTKSVDDLNKRFKNINIKLK